MIEIELNNEELFLLTEKRKDVWEKIIRETLHFVKMRPDKSMYDLIALILFLKLCKGKPFMLRGVSGIAIPNYPKNSSIDITIQPANFIKQLEEYLIKRCDEDIQFYYRWALRYEGEDFFAIDNLQNIIEYEKQKKHNLTNNRKYGEIADRLLDSLESQFWYDAKTITKTQKYVLIFNILVALDVIPAQEGLPDNDKLRAISNYLKSYQTLIKNM